MLVNKHSVPTFEMIHKPYAHQQECFDISKDRPAYALLMEMGTGKTKVIIDTMMYLFLKQEIDGVLILAPKSCYLNWLYEELPAHLQPWIPGRVAYWNADATPKQKASLWNMTAAKDDCLDIVIMNLEALATDRGYDFAHAFLKGHYPMGIVDESSAIKNPQAVKSKALFKLSHMMEYRRIMSGTPITLNPLDLYSQFRFLDDDIMGMANWVAFKNHYAVIHRITFGTRSFEKIEGYINTDELKAKIIPHSYRKLKSECLDLPEKIFLKRHIDLTDEQRAIYNKLKKEAMVEFSSSSMVSSTHVLTTMMKLHQICCGHVKDDSGNLVLIPSNRIKALMEILSQISGKVIIWVKFIADIQIVMKALEDEYEEGCAVSFYGDTSPADRQNNLIKFKEDKFCRFFVANETASKSLTITEAAYAVYYSYDYNLETWLQSQDRNHRIGQKSNVTYTSIIANDTLDEGIMEALLEKRNLADTILNNWQDFLK